MRHGSKIDPPNRFEATRLERVLDDVAFDDEYLQSLQSRKIEFIEDHSETIVSKNDSPDLPFNFSLNPYRGCIHACPYCYARPTHEYLGFNAGLDFETKIVFKPNAARLFRKFLSTKSWAPEAISFSGVTDCYQPAEREFRLTRQCLEVAAEHFQPVSIVTKNALILRDLDILTKMANKDLVHVFVSVTTLDPELARDMEPRTSTPCARLRTIETLADANVPVGVMVAPVVPGLNDSEIPAILKESGELGAYTAGYVLLRLPLTVQPVFEEWIRRTRPNKADMVLGRIKETRGGKYNNSQWGQRMVGTGEIADQIRSIFKTFQNKYNLERQMLPHNCTDFRVPTPESGQMTLF